MSDSVERIRRRQELRRSNAAVRHRNRYREHKAGQDPTDAQTDAEQGLMEYEAESEIYGDQWV